MMALRAEAERDRVVAVVAEEVGVEVDGLRGDRVPRLGRSQERTSQVVVQAREPAALRRVHGIERLELLDVLGVGLRVLEDGPRLALGEDEVVGR